jgi:hypothetical protein
MNNDVAKAGLVLVLVALFVASLEAAPPGPHRGLFISGSFQSMWSPLFKEASGSGEIPVDQSAGGASFAGGYEYNWDKFGVGARLAYFGGRFDGFSASEMPGSPTTVKYADPKLSFIFFDMIVRWFPVANVLGIDGFLGLGSKTESYTISGSNFPDWNGAKTSSEFDFSYGLGVRLNVVTAVSLFAELRWIPGLGTPSSSEYYWIVDGVPIGNSTTFANHTMVLTAGLAANFSGK